MSTATTIVTGPPAATLADRVLALLESKSGDVATGYIAGQLGEPEPLVLEHLQSLLAEGKVEEEVRFERALWCITPPPVKDTIARCAELLENLSEYRADYLFRDMRQHIERWQREETPEYKQECELEEQARQHHKVIAGVGLLTGEELPLVWERGMYTGCECPTLAMAPACTFKPGQRWRAHYDDYCIDSHAPKGDRLAHILIRDDLDPREVRRVVAEVFGSIFVEDFGDSFPELPTPPVYRLEGTDVSDCPWPVVFVPSELWPGCWKRAGGAPDATCKMERAFDNWDYEREAASDWPRGTAQEGGAA